MFEEAELEALLDKDSYQSQNELTHSLGLNKQIQNVS